MSIDRYEDIADLYLDYEPAINLDSSVDYSRKFIYTFCGSDKGIITNIRQPWAHIDYDEIEDLIDEYAGDCISIQTFQIPNAQESIRHYSWQFCVMRALTRMDFVGNFVGGPFYLPPLNGIELRQPFIIRGLDYDRNLISGRAKESLGSGLCRNLKVFERTRPDLFIEPNAAPKKCVLQKIGATTKLVYRAFRDIWFI